MSEDRCCEECNDPNMVRDSFDVEQPPNSDGCDRISTLPDEILSSILSLLPTKQAIVTSVLSKRWKPLWLLVPTFDFDDTFLFNNFSKEDYSRFVQSISTPILHLHHPIHKLCLMSGHSPFNDLANVTLWFNAAAQRGVHHVDLSFFQRFGSPPINLSPIFNCKTLVVLKLTGCSYNSRLEPISSVYLPSLQVLHLHNLSFSKRGCLAELLSGCPVLEDFKEDNSFCESGGDVVTNRELKTLPKLLRADISNSYPEIMRDVVNNVKFLRIEIKGKILGRSNKIPYVFPMFHNLTHIQLEYIIV